MKSEWGITALIVAATMLLFALMVQDQKRWNRFVRDHNCVVIGHKDGQSFTTVGADGKIGVGSTASQTGWKCDDGMEYWR